MPVFLLPEDDIVFPDPHLAEPDGLLAVGGDYSFERMLLAYNHGIFPWFMQRKKIYWYATNPRMLVFPDQYRPNHGLRRTLKKQLFTISINTEFTKVIDACARIRRREKGTWINRRYRDAMIGLHERGYAVSIECHKDGELAGGLYGVIAGNGFTGESMFSAVPDASKVAFHHLVLLARHMNWKFIDAQQDTPHIRLLGAVPVPFSEFYSLLTAEQDDKSDRAFSPSDP